MDAKSKILSPTADDLRQLIICDTDFSEAGETDLNGDTMQRLEQLGWLAEGEESGEYALTNAGRLAVRRALGDVVAFVQFEADRAGRTYIAGPMTGYANFNYPAFNAAAAQLRSLGIAAINPADHGVVPGATWEDYLRSDIAQLATCESIYFLPGWSKSKGATLEHHIAGALGMEMRFAEGAELKPVGDQKPSAWLIHWSHSSFAEPEVTTSASRAEAVGMLSDPPRIDPRYAAPPVQAVDLGPGIHAIADERERQLTAEGFSRESDQQYQRGELAKAATAYVQLAAMDLEAGTRDHIAWHGPAAVWPWAPEWWRPVDARRDLVRAGALIAAQIDLIDSAKAVGGG